VDSCVTIKLKVYLVKRLNIISKGDIMQYVLMLFDRYGIFMVFVLIALEYACFPLPSEIVLPFMGYMVNINAYNLVGVIIMSIIMGYLGSIICYVIGYYGGSKIYNKLYNKFPSWRKGLDSSHQFFYKYGNLSVMIGRVIPMCRTYVSFFAGIFKQSLFKYSLYSIIGITIWNVLLIFSGYFLASKWAAVENYYRNYKVIFFLLIIVFITSFFAYKMYKKRKRTKTINGD
jgi:membrane protein DedA with SNARE-associated domain